MFDSHPGADQRVEHVFDGFERGQGLHLAGFGDDQRDGCDVLIEPGPDRPEFLQQSGDSLCRAKLELFSSPVLQGSTHLEGNAILPTQQGQQSDMGVNLDQGRKVPVGAGCVQNAAEGGQVAAKPVGDGTGALRGRAVHSAAAWAEAA